MLRIKTSLLIGACVGAIATSASAQQEVVVRIGMAAPMTGPQAHYGKDSERGAQLAIDDLNAKGVTIGGKKVRWQLMPEDDAADPRQATAVAQKYVDMKINGVIGHLNSGATLPASKVYNDAGIPMVTPSATNPKITQQGFKYVFRTIGNDGSIGSGIAKYVHDTLKFKNVAIIDDRTAYGQGVADEFEKALKAAGGNVVARQYTNDKATEFSAILTSIRARKPDLIFYGGMDSQGAPLYRQIRKLGINSPLAGGDGLCTAEMVKVSTIGPDRNIYCGEAGIQLSQLKGGADFQKRFNDRFKADILLYAPYVYDAVMVMADAMVRAGSAEPDKYVDALAKADYQGITARIRFDAKGDLQNAAITLQTFEKGGRAPVGVIQ
ncbi:branched-chain amino acid ABC transporter substrate-binding protein [Hydrogenophaga intermedia]|jgi:branched-chain amino acid transport system substrate-binding protein|uniref:branched-chain amino acid ABC transporter substrate-binding protein n=1 Tax=Hydrogenophaga intermedia TaxID=65786 RepID=UPI002043C615|nr:branched-chain amino acid ABC transporter substrate-binding protein [Hydrogenophaga intermedia]MCM3563429.1 branched-chain amino acid ABC transporter substrate-binding protein [Hydrogenophaga intermedia]